MYGHQLLLPVPDIDRTQLLPGPRRQPDGLQRLPDDRARLPARLRELKAPRRPDGRPRPAPHRDRAGRRPSTTSSGPAPTRSCCWRWCTCCSPRGSPLPRRTSTGSTRCATAVAAVHPRARRGGHRRRRPTSSGGWRASSRRADGAAVVRPGRASPRRSSAWSATWAVQLLNLLTGNLDRPGGVMFTRARGRRRRPPDSSGAATTTCGAAGSAACRSSAASCRSRRWPTRSSPRARARSGRCSRVAGNPVLSTPDGRRLGEALAGLDFMAAVDIYVNETTRHADVILPPTSALERDHYDLVFHALAVRNTARFTPAVLRRSPTARCTTGRSTARSCSAPGRLLARQAAAEGAGWCRRRGCGSPRPGPSTCCCAPTGPGSRCAGCAAAPVDLGPLEPCLPERLMTPDEADRRRAAAGARRPGPARRGRSSRTALLLVGRRHQRDNNSWMHNTPAADQGAGPAPAAHAPRRPRVRGRSPTGSSYASSRRWARSRSRCRPATT